MSSTPQQPEIRITPTADYREGYSNSVQIRVSVWDFLLLFGTMTQPAQKLVEIHNFQGIYLSPQQAKALRNVLGQNVEQYEKAFGEIKLDPDTAKAGIGDLARRLGLGLERTAEGILEISAWNQANAIRQVAVQRGIDVRTLPLVAFGGSGPLLACRLIDLLGMSAAIIPRDPGSLSAFGLLTVDVRNDYVQTFVRDHDELDIDEVAGVYGLLRGRADGALAAEGFASADRTFARQADLRYAGQASEVRVDAPDGPVDGDFLATVTARFHDQHEATYGYCYRDDPSQAIEWVNVRVSGIGPIERPKVRRLATGDGDVERARIGVRPVHVDGRWLDADLYRRADLLAGDEVIGPAVVQEFSSTVPLAPGFVARVDDLANLVIRRQEEAA